LPLSLLNSHPPMDVGVELAPMVSTTVGDRNTKVVGVGEEKLRGACLGGRVAREMGMENGGCWLQKPQLSIAGKSTSASSKKARNSWSKRGGKSGGQRPDGEGRGIG